MIECPNCGNTDVYFESMSQVYVCPLCQYSWEPDIEDEELPECPECGSNECEETDDGSMYRCLNCGCTFPIE